MPNTDQVDYLIAGLSACGLFSQQITEFNTKCTSTTDRIFSNLATPVRAYSRSLQFTTASVQGYAATAVSAAPSGEDAATIEQLSALVASLTLSVANLASASASVVPPVSNRNKNNRGGNNSAATLPGTGGPKIHYCWTHGPQCSHPSARCIHRAPLHQETATDSNRMNGRN